MDDRSQPEPEYTHSSTSDVESPSAASRHAIGMFSHSRQFTVTGKTFTNVTNNYAAPTLPSGKYEWSAGAESITEFIDLLTLEQYHGMCWNQLGEERSFDFSASTTVNLGAVFRYSSNLLNDSDEIASLPIPAPVLGDWKTFEGSAGEVMPNGWTRFQSGDVFNNTLSMFVYDFGSNCVIWLSQANHIFCRLNIMSNFEDYAVLNTINVRLHVSQSSGAPLEGFLFLCPGENFRIGPSSFRWPACTAYWSLDPSGTDRLGPEEATQLRFPTFKLIAEACGYSWDASVYDGLRQFHEAKGFDPYSQDVARHLGHPFYRLSSERDALPWAYVDSEDDAFDADIDSDCDSAYPDDYESEFLLSAGDDSADLDVETESLHSEADVHDTAGGNRGPEPTEISNYANHNASGSTLEEDIVVEELLAPSRSLNILMSIQLALMLFLGLFWAYDYICLVRLVRNFIRFPIAK
ncbi:hypothetical protein MSAN_02133600 [Mycena sanguinolenta]|uniref:Uncharacterized protein n=1 Tax=Mycena sanguinolenta TaxID=230812 RepID=A0A8H6XH67_9AGAR|nr:hypothetical protein MSAN_02133600 [Mycena sanguinolenta]